jgi:hypothetical protein
MNVNREKLLTIAAAVGIIFLIFYWTDMAFNNAEKSASSATKTAIEKAEKASALASKAKSGTKRTNNLNQGLLSFLQENALANGVESKVSSIKPKQTPGAKEAAIIRLENLKYNEVVLFIKSVEAFSNIQVTNLKVNKRFDNENLLNLTMDIAKK